MTTTTPETTASISERFEATALPLHDSIYRANLRMTGDPVMAQDLTQETYLRAFRAFDSFEAGTNCRAWMLQISHNLFCRDYRGRKRITYRSAADDDVDVLAQFRGPAPARPGGAAAGHLQAARALPGGGHPRRTPRPFL
jgi:RNA polymerase sigma-70 factor, ECF subfamily